MKSSWKKLGVAVVASLVIGSIGIAQPAQAATAKGSVRTIKATIKGGKGLTLLVMSGTGQTLASKKLTRTSQPISLKTKKVSKTTGMTFQFVNSSGEYFGPAVLSWKGTKSTSAKTVYMRLKKSTAKTISLGVLTVKKIGAAKVQGYAVTSKKVSLASTTTSTSSKASKGRPTGVGSYGKSKKTSGSSVATASVAATAAQLPTVVQPPQPNQPQAPQSEGATVADTETLGGDKDRDGIINAFDVDDDGDAKLDSADSDSPTPQVSADDGAKDCGAIRWNIFTNFKATDPNFAGTLNAYGTNTNQSNGQRTATAIQNTMTMVFAPITQVCGSAVTKTEIKGNNVAYAPTSYETVANTCGTGDYQWLIGKGRMCDTGGAGFNFGKEFQFSGENLPSGQDTFSMRVTTAAGSTYEFTASAGFVFMSHPMLVSYDTGAGEQTINYGSSVAPIAITQSTVLTLKLYRPQRIAIDGEAAQLYDLGGFRYSPDIPNGTTQGSQGPGKCDALTVVDDVLTSDTPINADTKPTITLRWNIGACFTAKNVAWPTGNLTVDIQVEPTGSGGNSAQKLFLALS